MQFLNEVLHASLQLLVDHDGRRLVVHEFGQRARRAFDEHLTALVEFDAADAGADGIAPCVGESRPKL